MNKSVLWVILIIVVVALGIWYFRGMGDGELNRNAPLTGDQNATTTNMENEPEEEEEEEEAEVVYTNAGYSPAELRVSPGTTVVFRNQSSGSMWTASAPHPTHSDFPDFDSRVGIAPGGEYSFTFSEAGTYRYHNHLGPAHFGRVIVE